MPSILSIRSVLKTSNQVQGSCCSGIPYLILKILMYASSAGRSRKRSVRGYVSIYQRLCCTLRYKIRCESRASGATHKDYKIRREIPQRGTTQPLGLLSSLNNLSIRCEIPLNKAGRWGFEATSIHTAELTAPGTALFQEWSCRYSRPDRGTFSPEAGGSPK